LTPALPRHHFPITERWTYLNHAGVTPLATAAVEALRGYAGRVAAGGSRAGTGHAERAEQVRATAARLMGVPVRDVAFVKNTTEGLGFVANGLAWAPGDRVVVPDLEFPSTLYPWLALRALGVVVDTVPVQGASRSVPVEAFAEAIAAGPPPKVVATSWVQYGRGWRTDLAALARVCHDAGALLCADVIQGLGVLPAELEAWGVDFAMADAHKWMLGPEGIGVLYVRDRCLDLLRPLEPGWNSVVHREQWDNLDLVWDHGARRLEGGSQNMAGIHAMGASIDLLAGAGVQSVWAHVDGLCDRLCASLADVAGVTVLSDRSSPGGRSGIITLTVDGHDPVVVNERLLAEGIVCSPRGGGIRVSPHGYNTAEDIDQLVAAVAAVAASPATGPAPG
jgi:cysteine desulfurase/selenocysteine lyase